MKKAGTDFDNGKKIFDINFFIAGQTKYDIFFRTADGVEYDYDIDVVSGTILEKAMDYGDD